jgi:hypothetical protein
MRQSWSDLLFAHWAFPAAAVRPLIPAGLELQTWEGKAWIGVVPFRMHGVRPRWLPAVPWLSAFPELNVRTYVTRDGKPGVWFFSLDAANPVAVWIAQQMFHLPYRNAQMTCQSDREGWVNYHSVRSDGTTILKARYRPVDEPVPAATGSLDDWLTARYCLYAADPRGNIYRGEIDHPAWPLQRAEATIETNTMLQPLGLDVPPVPPLLHFSRRLDVVVWGLQRC